MKVYRIVPNAFFSGERLEASRHIALESLYYKMGYIPFSNKPGNHDFNTLNCQDLQGKYFYLFAEDAIFQGNKLIRGYHNLSNDTCSLLEYDVPEDLIIKHIGYGDYTDGIAPLYLIETFLEKGDISSTSISSDEISKDDKTNCIVESFRDSLGVLGECGGYSYKDLEYYQDLFWRSDLGSIAEDELRDALLNSALYYEFLKQKRELLSSPFITGNIAPVNMEFISYELASDRRIMDYYQSNGLTCNITKEHREFKKELLDAIRSDGGDKEQVKKLLKNQA